VKDLRWDDRLERWTLRFLVPVDVADGTYEARVVIVKRDGTLELATASYLIDSCAPDFDVELVGSRIRIRVNEPARKVTVASARDPQRRRVLEGDGRVFEGEVPASGRLRVVVADLARNEGVREVDAP
jgi:hypothetical protein